MGNLPWSDAESAVTFRVPPAFYQRACKKAGSEVYYPQQAQRWNRDRTFNAKDSSVRFKPRALALALDWTPWYRDPTLKEAGT